MPLTPLQTRIGRLLAQNRSEDSYLAGGAALLALPNSNRFSQDLDYFHDSTHRVATAFAADQQVLQDSSFVVDIDLSQPGYIRATVFKGDESTKLEWAQDSSWRFMPVIRSDDFGFQLHPIDIATNKILALAGRDESRDLIDAVYLHQNVLALGPLVWAAVGKDPGFTPLSLLDLLRRRGKVRPEDLNKLIGSKSPDIHLLKSEWLDALHSAESFIVSRPPNEVGCLYYSKAKGTFVDPTSFHADDIVLHYGRPGGVLPTFIE